MVNLKAIGISAGVAFLVGMGGGWKAHQTVTEARHAKALQQAQEQFTRDLEALQRDLDASDEERRQLSAELNAARSNVRTITREIVREVPKYVEDSTEECDRSLSPDLVRLYNRSIGRSSESATSEEVTTSGGIDALRLAGGNGE